MKTLLTGVDIFYPLADLRRPMKVLGLRTKVSAKSESHRIPPVYLDEGFNDEDRNMYATFHPDFEKNIYNRIFDKAVQHDVAFDGADELQIHIRELLADVSEGGNGAFIVTTIGKRSIISYSNGDGLGKLYERNNAMHEYINLEIAKTKQK